MILKFLLLGSLYFSMNFNAYSQVNSCKEYDGLTSTQVNAQIVRAYLSRNTTCLGRDIFYDAGKAAMTTLIAPFELAPFVAMVPLGVSEYMSTKAEWNNNILSSPNDEDDYIIGMNAYLGSVLGPILHDTIGGVARVGSIAFDILEDGLLNDKRDKFVWFRGIRYAFPASRLMVAELEKQKQDGYEGSACAEFKAQLSCLLSLKEANEASASASNSVAISQTDELKETDYLTLKNYDFNNSQRE